MIVVYVMVTMLIWIVRVLVLVIQRLMNAVNAVNLRSAQIKGYATPIHKQAAPASL